MKKSTKAVLLSALVFPGLGHFYLKKHLHGAVLALGAAISIYVLTTMAVHTALDVVQKIETGEVGLDVGAINQSLSKQSQGDNQAMSMATNVFILFWIIGLVDAYRVRRKQDQAAQIMGDP